MPPAELTPVAEDYLKVVWSAQEWSNAPVTTKHLAERLGVGASTVSETVRRLSAQGLLEHARYGAITLTDDGRDLAVAIVRRHRLIETYLVERLGYSWDEVHDEAEVLEHAVSDRMISAMDHALGFPTRDPHGDPIPTPAGVLAPSSARTLADLAPGAHGIVSRISDADPDMLRYFAHVGLGLDHCVRIVERREYAGVISIEWDAPDHRADDGGAATRAAVDLGLPAARAVWVDEIDAADPSDDVDRIGVLS